MNWQERKAFQLSISRPEFPPKSETCFSNSAPGASPEMTHVVLKPNMPTLKSAPPLSLRHSGPQPRNLRSLTCGVLRPVSSPTPPLLLRSHLVRMKPPVKCLPRLSLPLTYSLSPASWLSRVALFKDSFQVQAKVPPVAVCPTALSTARGPEPLRVLLSSLLLPWEPLRGWGCILGTFMFPASTPDPGPWQLPRNMGKICWSQLYTRRAHA